jgi:ATP-dependent Clp protease ATP-binding subunit ClpA
MNVLQRFTKEARTIVRAAVEIAHADGATTVEAEHLLLAVSRRADPVAGALRAHGLDEDGLRDALEREWERSLAAVGVSADRPAFTPHVTKPDFAHSAKAALEGAVRAAAERRDSRIGTGHVVLGTLRARRGTVPRALALADVDPDELAGAVSAVT